MKDVRWPEGRTGSDNQQRRTMSETQQAAAAAECRRGCSGVVRFLLQKASGLRLQAPTAAHRAHLSWRRRRWSTAPRRHRLAAACPWLPPPLPPLPPLPPVALLADGALECDRGLLTGPGTACAKAKQGWRGERSGGRRRRSGWWCPKAMHVPALGCRPLLRLSTACCGRPMALRHARPHRRWRRANGGPWLAVELTVQCCQTR